MFSKLKKKKGNFQKLVFVWILAKNLIPLFYLKKDAKHGKKLRGNKQVTKRGLNFQPKSMNQILKDISDHSKPYHIGHLGVGGDQIC